MLAKRLLLAATACACLQGCEAIPLRNVLNGTFLHGEPVIDDHVWLLPQAAESVDAQSDNYLPSPCRPDKKVDYEKWNGERIKPCVYAMRQLIDVRFYHYQDSLLAAESGGTTAADLAIVGMSAAGTLVGGGTSQVLNAASGALAGGEAKINNDVLRSKSIEIILQQMDTDRATEGTLIDERLAATPDPVNAQDSEGVPPTSAKPVEPAASAKTAKPSGTVESDPPATPNAKPYTDMYDAANDLYKYARAGSWVHAILALQAQTGAQSQACKKTQNDVHAFSQTNTGQDTTDKCPLAPSP